MALRRLYETDDQQLWLLDDAGKVWNLTGGMNTASAALFHGVDREDRYPPARGITHKALDRATVIAFSEFTPPNRNADHLQVHFDRMGPAGHRAFGFGTEVTHDPEPPKGSWRRHFDERNRATEHNLHQILSRMEKGGVHSISVEFRGRDRAGQVVSITGNPDAAAYDLLGTRLRGLQEVVPDDARMWTRRAAPSCTVEAALGRLSFDMLDLFDSDWNDELGSVGVITFSEGEAHLSVSMRQVETAQVGTTFSGAHRKLPADEPADSPSP